ncbi:type I-F CRISPR-associated endoribonuclease Cas6/Csy4 [Paenalcaligenes hermetiae]|uniref:Type I-F CRISPR-associated endoribonuclease Cas6/Csy4 n=1 Tax=Paenalcaligenes hermetiae TaxID=1157987 RepID=A0ABP9LX08_9BURK
MQAKTLSHYFTINILNDPDFPVHQVMTAVYMRLHQALVQLQQNHIGVSFPHYRKNPRTLGEILRLHGTQQDLAALREGVWLQQGVRDHIIVSDTMQAPQTDMHCHVSRVQPKYNKARLVRRQQRRKSLSYQEALELYEHFTPSTQRWPFVEMRSKSSAQTFPLFISQQLTSIEKTGVFSFYGLSSQATVPWF